jgi:hypothetical protein
MAKEISEFWIPAEAGENVLLDTVNFIDVTKQVSKQFVKLLWLKVQDERAIDYRAFFLILQP